MISGETSMIVIVFDICSSTSIIEDLTRQKTIPLLETFLRKIGHHLERDVARSKVHGYKFMGDGWILLADESISGDALLGFLQRLCEFYREEYGISIKPNLREPPTISGITFGLAKGKLIKTKLFGKVEFIGRPINVACRLQGAVKDSKHSPAYRALVTKPVFDRYFRQSKIRYRKVTRKLRNIKKGKDYNCVKLFLLSPESGKRPTNARGRADLRKNSRSAAADSSS